MKTNGSDAVPSMDVCRSCLSSRKIEKMDETLIDSYNLLTNLNVTSYDGLPLLICLKCSATINKFHLFRDNCIESETFLKKLIEQKKINSDHIATETILSLADVNIELKEENVSVSEYLDDTAYDYDEEQIIEHDIDVNDDDEKPIKHDIDEASDSFLLVVKDKFKADDNVELKEENVSISEYLDDTAFDDDKEQIIQHDIDVNDDDEKTIKHDIDEASESFLLVVKDKFKGGPGKKRKNESVGTRSSKRIKKIDTPQKVTKVAKYPCGATKKRAKKGNVAKKKENARPSDRKKKMDTPKTGTKASIIYPCGLCTKSFDNKPDVTQHVETHKTDDLSCVVCKAQFLSWPSLVGHRLAHNPSQQTQCHLCTVSKLKPAYMEAHFIKMHCDPSENLMLLCPICTKSYETARRLQKHLVNVHSEKRIPCPICGKKYTTNSLLRVHMIKHGDDKKYKCDKCDYKSKLQTNLRAHKIRIHSDISWKCDKCRTAFDDEEKCKKHKCNVGNIVCPFCGKVPKNIKRHLLIHKKKTYECDLCSKILQSKRTLKEHINRHNGIRNHVCEFCPLKFSGPSGLLKHRRTHTGERPYVCKVCSKGFMANHNLKVHMRVHGEDLIKKRVVVK